MSMSIGHRVPAPRRQRGVSLLELMISMTVGLILTAGVIQLFTNSNSAYRFHEALSRVQENGRFAMDELTRDLRMAGFLGCTNQVGVINNIISAPPAELNPVLGLQGWDANGTVPGVAIALNFAAAPVATGGGPWTSNGGAAMPALNAMANSDIVRVWRADEISATINNIAVGASTVVNTEPALLGGNDFVVLSDCRGVDVAQACLVQQNGTASTDLTLSNACAPGNVSPHTVATGVGGEAHRLHGNVYYISKRDADAARPPSLFRSRLTAAGLADPVGDEIAEGVENMQVLYGVDDNGDRQVDRYIPALNVPDWEAVIAVRVSLLLASVEDNIVDTAQPVFFNGVQQVPADRRLRQVMTSTVALRNRMP